MNELITIPKSTTSLRRVTNMGGNKFARWQVRGALFKPATLEALELVKTKVAIERSKRASIAFSTCTMHSFTTFSPYI
jgi:hypothetical protein